MSEKKPTFSPRFYKWFAIAFGGIMSMAVFREYLGSNIGLVVWVIAAAFVWRAARRRKRRKAGHQDTPTGLERAILKALRRRS